MKKGMKKVMRSKDLHIGLLMMMATMDQAAGNSIGEEDGEEQGRAWNFMTPILATAIEKVKDYMQDGSNKTDKETQASCQANLEAWERCGEENEELKTGCSSLKPTLRSWNKQSRK